MVEQVGKPVTEIGPFLLKVLKKTKKKQTLEADKDRQLVIWLTEVYRW